MKGAALRIALVGLILGACRPPPPGFEADLLGWRFVERVADGPPQPVFDTGRLPIVRAPADVDGLTLTLGGRPLPTEAVTRGRYRIHRVVGAEGLPSGRARLVAEAPGWSARRWTVRIERPPETLPAIAPAVAHRKAGRAQAALEHLDSLGSAVPRPASLWVGVERARALTRLGRTDAAIDAWVAAADDARGVPSEVARRLRAAAWLANDSRRLVRAAELLDRARSATPDDPTSRALLVYLEGVFANRLRDLAAAGRHFDEARSGFESLGLDRQARQAIEALAINAALIGDLERALERYAELTAAIEPDDTHARQRLALHHGLALSAAMAVGRVPRDRARLERLFETARTLAERGGRPDDVANAAVHLAEVAASFGDVERAEHALRMASAAVGDRPGLASTWIALLRARVKRMRGAADALAAFEAVEALAELRGEDELRWMARLGRARSHRDAGRAEAALSEYANARAIVTEVGRRAAVRQGRAGFHGRRRAPSAEAIELLVEKGRVADGFALADTERARLLREARQAARIARLDPSRRGPWIAHMQTVERATATRQRLLDREKTVPLDGRAAWRAAVQAAERARFEAYDAALAHLDAAAPEVDADPADVARTRARLPPGAALVAISRSPEGWRSFWVDAERLDVAAVGDDPFAPWRARIAHVSRLFIVPGGHAGAFSAAVHGPEPLLSTTPLAWLPYAGALSAAPPVAGAPLVVADARRDLPHARAEGMAVAARWPDARLLAGDGATRSAVLDGLSSARILHFAGHGILRPSQPWAAHLALAGRERLDLLDVLARSIPASVVMLSGCETGADGPLLDDRVLGLPEAFLAAGAGAVIATDRMVGDVGARRFADAFYAAGGDRDPVAAAHIASLRLREAGLAEWSAFRVFGGW